MKKSFTQACSHLPHSLAVSYRSSKFLLTLVVLIGLALTADAQCTWNGSHSFGTIPTPTSCNTFGSNLSVASTGYGTFNCINGVEYVVSTCDGSWDSQITGYNSSNTATSVFYDDDNGPDCTGTTASVDWTASFTGTVNVLVERYNCGNTWESTSALLKYKQVSSVSNTTSNATVCVGATKALTYTVSSGSGVPTWSVVGGTASISGTTLTATTAGTVTVRATLGVCSSDVTFTVNSKSTAPTSAAASPATICSGGSSTLTYSGGSLGTGATARWYTGSCGGTLVGSGNSLSVSPTSTTTYYVRYEDPSPCSTNTACVSTTVTVNTPSTAPTGISGTTPVCQGTGITLTETGGALGSGASYQWGTGTVGTNVFQTSTSTTANVTPSSTTTYWVSVTGSSSPCSNPSGSATKTITVNNPSTAPTSISGGGGTICQGSSVTLTASGGALGTGASYQWGTGSVGTNVFQTSTSTTASVTPSSTTSYWVSVTGTTAPCSNPGGSATTTVTVNTPSSAVTGISGGGGTVCQGSGVTLTATGASLGTGASYQWGTGSVIGTNPIGGATAASYAVTPSSTTTYWVSVTGPSPCNGAGGVTTTVNVNTPSTAPTGISGGGGTVC
ncbi:MAG: hypothetical protein JST83_18965, partial [Bacteroidetes bacterium]|nr:hypothetical protein [Bacteroidota bacterium]